MKIWVTTCLPPYKIWAPNYNLGNAYKSYSRASKEHPLDYNSALRPYRITFDLKVCRPIAKSDAQHTSYLVEDQLVDRPIHERGRTYIYIA